MPLSIARDDVLRRFVATATGVLTYDEVLHLVYEVRKGEERFYGLLLDAREATSVPSIEQWRDLATRVSGLTTREGRARVALLATDDAVYGIFRMYEISCDLASAPIVRACRTLEEAEAWLGGESHA
jgi:hypothetical protein